MNSRAFEYLTSFHRASVVARLLAGGTIREACQIIQLIRAVAKGSPNDGYASRLFLSTIVMLMPSLVAQAQSEKEKRFLGPLEGKSL